MDEKPGVEEPVAETEEVAVGRSFGKGWLNRTLLKVIGPASVRAPHHPATPAPPRPAR